MRLYVGLRYDIDTVLVAEVIPEVGIGIVAGTHGVEVELLHDLDVLDHALPREYIATVGIQLVAVSTFEEYWLAIHQDLRVLQLDLAEAYLHGDHL